MRRVFISFLGTSNYVPTRYRLGETISQPHRFVQQTLIEDICIAQRWTSNDAIMIFHTKQAHDANWIDNGQQKIEEPEDCIGLESILNGLVANEGLNATICHFNIAEGFSNDEIWNIFDTVYSHLENGDQIYFDVTHAFRSIPLFAIPLFNYAHFLKGTNLKAIYYGAFETLGPAYQVRKMDRMERIADIINLIDIVNLQATNSAASCFVEFGKVGNIVRTNYKNQSNDIDAITKIKEQLKYLDFYIETCDMDNIRQGDYISKVSNILNGRNINIRPAERVLLDNMIETFKSAGFKGRADDSNIEAAIMWALKYDMVQQAYTLCQEFLKLKVTRIIDYELEQSNIAWNSVFRNNDMYRDYAGKLLARNERNPLDSNYLRNGWRNDTRVEVENVCSEVQSKLTKIRGNYMKITNTRNDLNHANGNNVRNSAVNDMNTLKSILRDNYNVCIQHINNLISEDYE